jgi:hypothetical protein
LEDEMELSKDRLQNAHYCLFSLKMILQGLRVQESRKNRFISNVIILCCKDRAFWNETV